ncbi:S8 family serine peptidase [Oscillatoria amoena NRMC-F 0135]|nr:S8 family serine peptidase [Oscillatoria amoena NRMC-F 0135]
MFRWHNLSFLGIMFLGITLARAQSLYRPGVIHVKFKQQSYQQLQVSQNGRRSGIPDIDRIFEAVKASSIKRIFREAGKFEKAHQAYGLHLWYEIQFDEAVPMVTATRQFSEADHFEIVEPARAYRLAEPIRGQPVPVQSVLSGPPNDPRFGEQWHYHNTGQTGGTPGADISLLQAWAQETGKPSVIIAVIDGGIDYLHPDINQSMWINTDEIPNNGIDDDQNGYVDDIYGYGFGDNTGTIFPNFHGTHVGGTIAAVTNNGIGVSGIAGGSGSGNGVRLMSLAGFGNFGVGGFEAAMVYAADNGAVISQNSWGGGGFAIEAAIDYFIARAGLDNSDANFEDNIQIGPMAGGIVIFAAGNSNSDSPFFGYPASYPPVIAVASTDHNDQKSSFSNYGSWVDISAPGSDVLSTYPISLGSYALLSGTSMACPHVSGVAALIISKFGDNGFVPAMVWDRLQLSADNIDARNPDFINKLGSGRLNANHALEANDDIPPAAITDLSVIETGLTSLTLTWTAPGSSGMEGSATSYDLRYSLVPITEANFNESVQVLLTRRPLPAGNREEVEITNLLHSTTYYIAIKAKDFSGNIASLSNIASASTLLPPVIDVAPQSLTENLFSGETSARYITVTNSGASALEFEVRHRALTQNGSSFPQGGFSLQALLAESLRLPKPLEDRYQKAMLKQPSSGISYTMEPGQNKFPLSGGRLFILNSSFGTIDELNPVTGALIHSIPAPEPVSGGRDGLAYDGNFLYFINGFGTNLLYRINPSTGAIVSSINLTGIGSFDALGHSGSFLYVLDYGSGRILEIDFDAGSVTRIVIPGLSMVGGLTFAGSRGTVFVTNSPNTIYELNIQSGEVINSFSLNGSYSYGLGYSEALSVLFSADVSNGIVRALDPDNGQLLYSLPVGYTSALASDEGGGGWLDVGDYVTTLLPDESTQVPVHFDANELLGGTYTGAITISSNDPASPQIEIPVTLQVTGAPNIVVMPASIDFGNAYEGAQKIRSFVVRNTGTDALQVTTVTSDNPSFTVTFNPVEIAPKDSATFNVTFHAGALGSYAGTLTIESNDPNEGSVMVNLSGQVVLSPILGVSPDSIGVTVPAGQTTSSTISLSNSGAGDLVWEVRVEGQGDDLISSVLGKLNDGYSAITSIIPNRYDFFEGETGHFIVDGGNDMYDGGNYLSTNIGGYVMYSNKAVATSSYFGPAGKYFTAKYPGLFVLVADVAINNFYITGNAGADGIGNVDGAVLSTVMGEKVYKGFVKRTYNAWDPSINHLIIVEDNGTASQSFPQNTDDDAHSVLNLGGVKRLYYLLYAGTNGYYIDNAATQAIMEKFLRLAGDGVSWATATPESGNTSPGNSSQVQVGFNAQGMVGGVYPANLVVQSNDPVDEVLNIPVTMTVVGIPDIHLPETSISFGAHYQGDSYTHEVVIANVGSEVLSVSSITSSNSTFTVSNQPFQIAPGAQALVQVGFNTSTVGTFTGALTIASNDPDEPSVAINLSGTVTTAALLTVLPDPISMNFVINQRKTINLVFKNTGGESLLWNLTYYYGPISFNPSSGTINQSGQQTVQLTVDAWNLPPGSYGFYFYLYYNHPTQPSVYIPVNITVANNRGPVLVTAIPTQHLNDDNREVSINLAEHISDPDGDVLQFSIAESVESIVSSRIVGSVLTIEAAQMGSTQIQVVAEDHLAARLQTEFNVTVGAITDIDNGISNEISCYPNPFDDHTAIYFSLARQSLVQLTVFDAMGRTAEHLINNQLEAGDHVARFGGSNYPAGLYYVKLVVNGKTSKTVKAVKK